jgi:outer membrane protein OmpA-like peptidoglycan-associated protein
VHSRATEFTLALGGARARVTHTGGPGAAGAGPAEAPASGPAVDPSVVGEPAVESDVSLASVASPGESPGARLAHAMADGHQLASLIPGAPPELLHWTQPARAHDAPVVFAAGSASLSPEARAALDALVARLGPEDVVTLEARGDGSLHDGLAPARAATLRAALLGRGVPAARLHEREAVDLSEPIVGSAAPAASVAARRIAAVIRWVTPASEQVVSPEAVAAAGPFDIRRSDRDIAGALRRWGARVGVDVVWAADVQAPVTGDLQLPARHFTDAVAQVLAGLRARGYPLQARAVGEREIRFVEQR